MEPEEAEVVEEMKCSGRYSQVLDVEIEEEVKDLQKEQEMTKMEEVEEVNVN